VTSSGWLITVHRHYLAARRCAHGGHHVAVPPQGHALLRHECDDVWQDAVPRQRLAGLQVHRLSPVGYAREGDDGPELVRLQAVRRLLRLLLVLLLARLELDIVAVSPSHCPYPVAVRREHVPTR
jgi:hypothetical protein